MKPRSLHPLPVTPFTRHGPKVCMVRFFAASKQDRTVETPSARFICKIEPLMSISFLPTKENCDEKGVSIDRSIWMSDSPVTAISFSDSDCSDPSVFFTSWWVYADDNAEKSAPLSVTKWLFMRFMLSSNPKTNEKPSPCAAYGTSWIAPAYLG